MFRDLIFLASQLTGYAGESTARLVQFGARDDKDQRYLMITKPNTPITIIPLAESKLHGKVH